jgi:hypothetical protein
MGFHTCGKWAFDALGTDRFLVPPELTRIVLKEKI